ncbi:hypothetical protein KP509_14G097300 [Ceratopteris richardii]|uniref:Uncharacterized protein n=1 Tax=Ceratopteris richardii TaxID=49495 RepID=A0A8T2THU2_CERRI|nr:hypothetical protein KP509_14G097300 [Ceratopteris richardii]
MCIVVENQPDFGHVLEDNVLALLDSVGVKNADDIEDDKMSFIEAVHTLSIAGTQPKAPTWSVHMAVYRLLEENHSLAVKMASYSLLVEIAQQYPHIFIRENNSRDRKRKAVLNMKIWSPFREDLIGEGKSKDRERNLRSDSEYPEEFVSLLREIQETLGEKAWLQPADEQKKKLSNLSTDKIAGLILKFDYIFKIMEHDFNCWFRIFFDIRKLKIMSDCYLLTVFEYAFKPCRGTWV